jgi:DNA-binding transcriptional ArsR family regulator
MTVFEALAEPVRRDILALLRDGERPAGALVEALGLPQPSVSKHLKTLREAGLVHSRVEGPRRFYRLDPAPLAALDAWLAPYRAFWADKLDALGNHLKRSD